jgi:pectinesterase inhibitor-like protein
VLQEMAIQVSVSLCLIVIPIALSFLLSSYHFAIASNEIGNSLIAKSCNQTEFPDVCISTLESDPRSSNANLTDLSKIGFELTVTKSNETLAEAFKLLINADTDGIKTLTTINHTMTSQLNITAVNGINPTLQICHL